MRIWVKLRLEEKNARVMNLSSPLDVEPVSIKQFYRVALLTAAISVAVPASFGNFGFCRCAAASAPR